MYSVRKRLTLVLAVGFAALTAGTGCYVTGTLSEHLVAEFDAALVTKARAIAALTDQENGRIEFDYTADSMPEFERGERPEYFQFWLDDGMVLLRSSRLDNDLPRIEPPSVVPAMDVSAIGVPALRDAALPDGRAGRLVQLTYVPKGPEDVGDDDEDAIDPTTLDPSHPPRGLILVVASGREHLDTLLARMRLLILGVGGIAIVLAALLVWRALAMGFRPIDSIAAQVERLDADGLASPVAVPRTPRELAPVVEQLNALLKRLHTSFERERRFAGNVAHELRTPIAELRSLATVGAKWPDDETSVVRFFEDVDDIADRMEGVIANLLLLARCQAGVEHVARRPVSLRQVVASAWSKLAPDAASSGVHLRVEMPEDVVVESDPDKLSIVFANVLGNAASYACPNSEIRCVGATRGSRFRLEFVNAAERLSTEELANLTEPFWRKDEARSAAEHAGLGLSLVSALADLLRLKVGFDQDPDGTFRVVLEGRALRADQSPSQPLRHLG